MINSAEQFRSNSAAIAQSNNNCAEIAQAQENNATGMLHATILRSNYRSKFSVHDTTGWGWETIAPYWPALRDAVQKLVARFPDDMTAEALLGECARGERRLWLVLEDGVFVSFAMTNLRTVQSTGRKIATLSDLAGERTHEYAAELNAALERWGAEEGADILAVEGRDGWRRMLKNFGYEPYAVLYRKVAA